MKSAMLRDVTQDEKAQFLRDGVVCLRRIVAPECIGVITEGMEELRGTPSAYATVVSAGDLYMYIDQMPSLHNARLRQVALESGVANVAKQLLAAKQLRWVYDQLFYKGSGPVAETPWHQDTAYGFLHGMDVIRLWIPVDPVPRETTIEVVRASHLWNVEYATTTFKALEDNKESASTSKFDYLAKQAETLPAVPDIEARRESFDIVGHAVEPGDVVAFNYHILHHAGSGLNPHSKRRALAVLYADEQVSMKRRPNPVPDPVAHGGMTWQDGQALSDFPQAFPAV
jgi:ectoine hydroxylase-related dioxygenase (phytanoyl-CoA dioxygenase family)